MRALRTKTVQAVSRRLANHRRHPRLGQFRKSILPDPWRGASTTSAPRIGCAFLPFQYGRFGLWEVWAPDGISSGGSTEQLIPSRPQTVRALSPRS